MAIVGFPAATLPLSVLTAIVRGGQDKVREAGAVLVGGHTIIDEELKFGLSVTGQVHPRRVLTNATAVPGDLLVLTKPLGTGLLATAAKQDRLDDASRDALHAGMRALNRDASRVALDVGVRCATDVTGFGLLGHASHVARASGVTVLLHGAALPERNERFAAPLLRSTASEADFALALDPQTSGGLLLAVPPARAAEYLSRVPGSVVVGEVAPRQDAFIVLD
jgi:selenide,water dikinase